MKKGKKKSSVCARRVVGFVWFLPSPNGDWLVLEPWMSLPMGAVGGGWDVLHKDTQSMKGKT